MTAPTIKTLPPEKIIKRMKFVFPSIDEATGRAIKKYADEIGGREITAPEIANAARRLGTGYGRGYKDFKNILFISVPLRKIKAMGRLITQYHNDNAR